MCDDAEDANEAESPYEAIAPPALSDLWLYGGQLFSVHRTNRLAMLLGRVRPLLGVSGPSREAATMNDHALAILGSGLWGCLAAWLLVRLCSLFGLEQPFVGLIGLMGFGWYVGLVLHALLVLQEHEEGWIPGRRN